MGYSLGWVAVRGAEPSALRDALDLQPTGSYEDVPESPAVGAHLPTGWYLVLIQRAEHLLDDDVMRRASAQCEAVACFVEEHVMFSSAVAWNHGSKTWSVTHDSEKGREHLAVVGVPPSYLKDIQDRANRLGREGDAEVDYAWEVPVELAQVVTGFRHDAAPGEAVRFEVLVHKAAEDVPWWKKWVRR